MEPGQRDHIYNHANGTENIFREEENYRYFLQQYAKYLGGVVDTYVYCLMPNHFTENIDDWRWTSWQAYNQPGKKSLLERDYYRHFFDGMEHLKAMITSKKNC